MKHIGKLIKLGIVVGVWLICYRSLMPDITKTVLLRGEKLFEQCLLSVIPMFVTGFMLHIEGLVDGIKEKKKIHKWILTLFVIILLLGCVVPACYLNYNLSRNSVIAKLLDILLYGQMYLFLWLCSGYLLTCIFED